MFDDEAARLLKMLRDAVRYSGYSNREIERRMGFSANSGYLSRLFAGTRELKIRQLLQILEAIEFPAASFFHAAYPSLDAERMEAENLRHVLARVHAAPAAAPEAPAPEPAAPPKPGVEEMDRLVREALRRLLREEEGG